MSGNRDTGRGADDARLVDLVEKATFEPGTDGTRTKRQERVERARALAALMKIMVKRARAAGVGAVTAGRWLAEEIAEIAPRIPVRDADTLHRHYAGLTDVEIADQLIRTAKRTTAALGAAAGGLASIEFTAPPALLLAPVQLSAEIFAVAAVELKLVAELHEVLGSPATGSPAERGTAYMMSWVRRRAVNPQVVGTGVSAALGTAAKKELRSHVLRRIGRSTTKLAPFMAGAVAGAEINRRATADLGEKLKAELTGRRDQRWFRRI